MIFMLSYLIASTFIAVFDVSANTILQCYLLDKEVAAQQGMSDPDPIPPTMTKFFGSAAVQAQIKATQEKHSGSLPKPEDEAKQNLLV